MRLVGGETETEGRLEFCDDGRWGTVCDNKWTDNHTAVVCRQMGFSDVVEGIGACYSIIIIMVIKHCCSNYII